MADHRSRRSEYRSPQSSRMGPPPSSPSGPPSTPSNYKMSSSHVSGSPPPTGTPERRLKPSTAESGFFQEAPKLGNQYADDLALQRVLSFYLTSSLAYSQELQQELFYIAETATSEKVARWIEDAERDLPSLEGRGPIEKQQLLDVWGRKKRTGTSGGGHLKTSKGWKRLGEWGGREGVVSIGYENEFGPYSRVVQFAKYYIYSPSSALQTCPLAMTDGAARLLEAYSHTRPSSIPTTPSTQPIYFNHSQQPGVEQVFQDAYAKLTSRGEPGRGPERWTSGQWMTERPGGSDVSNTETVAVYSPLTSQQMGEMGISEHQLGPWVIDGYKFFSSATDADMTILLAKTEGAKGLSAFYAPLKRKRLLMPREGMELESHDFEEDHDQEWNGVSVVRLKKKLGTRPVATGEIEVQGMRGWLIGKEGDGVRAITTVLNITRVHNAVNAVAFMRRGLAIAKAYAQVRRVSQNRVLAQIPLHLRTLAHLETVFRGALHLSFFTVSILGFDEHPDSLSPGATTAEPPQYHLPTNTPEALKTLFLILTPLSKALTAKFSISTLAECMESLGGVGYLENEEYGGMNVQRLFRDANVLSIWEGTTNVLAVELVRGLLRRSDAVSPGGKGVNVIGEWIAENLGMSYQLASGEAREILERCKVKIWNSWNRLEKRIESRSKEELIAGGRELVGWLGYIVCGVLLIIDARRDGEVVSVEVCRRWVLEGVGRGGMIAAGGGEEGEQEERREREENVEERAEVDHFIVYGRKLGRKPLRKPRL